MPTTGTPESFELELNRLATKFERSTEVTRSNYPEARLRSDFLDPLFPALGWDLANDAGLIVTQREVEIESRTDIAGKAKRADYLFRTDGRARFTCEAKKPRVDLGAREAFQANRDADNMGLPLVLLSDFEELKIYVISGRAHDRLADFISGLSADKSPYLFNVIPVEILRSVYERFWGKSSAPSAASSTTSSPVVTFRVG